MSSHCTLFLCCDLMEPKTVSEYSYSSFRIWRSPVAQLVKRVANVQRLCHPCSGQRFISDMWPFAACHPLSLTPFPILLQLSYLIKSHEKHQNIIKKKKKFGTCTMLKPIRWIFDVRPVNAARTLPLHLFGTQSKYCFKLFEQTNTACVFFFWRDGDEKSQKIIAGGA